MLARRSLSKVARFARNFSCTARANAPEGGARKTALYDYHKKHGAKFTDFAGWQMPLQYAQTTVIESHMNVRKHCGLFDVSHMLQTRIRGKYAAQMIESMTCADLAALRDGMASLTVFLNPDGGAFDDAIVTRSGDSFFVVNNASNAKRMQTLFAESAERFRTRGQLVEVEHLPNALVALQGPHAARILGSLFANNSSVDLAKTPFMSAFETTLSVANKDVQVRVTRCGYTGEDGFEISVKPDDSAALCDAIIKNRDKLNVTLCGLASRDSLRTEAGLCLYGHELDEKTTPVEAGLTWLIHKGRRTRADFPGAPRILKQLAQPDTIQKRLFGLRMRSAGFIPRTSTPVHLALSNDKDSKTVRVGTVTSGTFSPVLSANLAIAFLQFDMLEKTSDAVRNDERIAKLLRTRSVEPGARMLLEIRGKMFEADSCRMPFVPTNYHPQKSGAKAKKQ